MRPVGWDKKIEAMSKMVKELKKNAGNKNSSFSARTHEHTLEPGACPQCTHSDTQAQGGVHTDLPWHVSRTEAQGLMNAEKCNLYTLNHILSPLSLF